jgi:hypothetical protein
MRPLGALRPEQVLKVLELTDSFNIHREAVTISLATEPEGSVTLLPDGRVRIVCLGTLLFGEWLSDLRKRLQAIDSSRVMKH